MKKKIGIAAGQKDEERKTYNFDTKTDSFIFVLYHLEAKDLTV